MEVEILLCWALIGSATAIQHRLVEPHSKWSGNDSSGYLSHSHGRVCILERPAPLERRFLSSLSETGLCDTLAFEVSAIADEPHGVPYQATRNEVMAGFVPHAKKRASEISITFIRPDHSPFHRISPTTGTFNVVLQYSKIFDFVAKNDLHTVQRLLNQGLASPLDVDGRGRSLLQVDFLNATLSHESDQ